MNAYNPELDSISQGAVQSRAWKSYQAQQGEVDKGRHSSQREEEVVDGTKKEYGTRYPSVWTKDPHGGKYRIDKGPGAAKGYDALEQKSDGTMIERPAGYEKPQSGPTTNFVGNHMTQGAIDLVQYELTKIHPHDESKQQRLEAARGILREPPQLISITREDTPEQTHSRLIETYTWEDIRDVIRITIRLDLLAPIDVQKVSVAFTDRSVAVKVPRNGSSPLVVHALQLRLFACVDTKRCVFRVEGDALVIELGKVDVTLEWSRLQEIYDASRALSDNPVASQSHQLIDLRSLRREVIAKREGKLISTMSWVQKDVNNVTAGDIDEVLDELDISASNALENVLHLVMKGDYGEAIRVANKGLEDDNAPSPVKINLLSERARLNIQIGALKAAISDYSSMLDIDSTADTYTCRAQVYEQLENFEAALQDISSAQQLRPHDSGILQTFQRLRSLVSKKCEIEKIDRAKKQQGGMQSVPRPGMAQFENRGKAGACF